MPWEEGRGVLLDATAAPGGGTGISRGWLEKTEGAWDEHGRGRRTLVEQYDYFGQLSAQFPLARVRVVYTKAGKNLVSAVVREPAAVIDHKLYWGAVGLEEAHYLCGILNSEAVRKQVEQYQSQGQWGHETSTSTSSIFRSRCSTRRTDVIKGSRRRRGLRRRWRVALK